MKGIVAVDLNWGIGCTGKLLQWIPEDMKFFKQMTLGKVVIMGRETFESLPGQEPLKDRINIVLTKNRNFTKEKVLICRSLDELFTKLQQYNLDDVFVIGGASVYSQLLPYCAEFYVTKIHREYVADKYFINLDKQESWNLVETGDLKTYNNVHYRFLKYINGNCTL